MKIRCPWSGDDPDYITYHDVEWGAPCHDDLRLFEFLLLEGAQAGLSWLTILRKRPNYHRAFDAFDPEKIARYDSQKQEALVQDSGIVRNRLKIRSAVQNARAFLDVQEAFGSFDSYIWRFVDGVPIRNAWKAMEEIPAQTPLALAMSKDLKKRGFNFVGPTICYAYMQSMGMVNDHLVDCFRYSEV
ncbi:MAG: DNA-3-methyladenine glycosylase I [Desulfatibacillum sp.]|nr:DNA-3-methyladenine glycosylase I [Desulfatibacillum sp.]